MKEIGDASFHFTEDHAKKIVDSTFPPHTIQIAHAKAQEVETTLNELINTNRSSIEDSSQLIADMVDELDETCGHMHKDVTINGYGSYYAIDALTIRSDEDSGPQAEKIETIVKIDELQATSLGYKALFSATDFGQHVIIQHVASMHAQPIIKTEGHGTIYQSGYLALPTDGSTDVRITDEKSQSRLELLQDCVPDLLEEIDVAVLNSSDLSKQLRNLSKVNFADDPVFRDRGGQGIRAELASYINELLSSQFDGIHYISGAKDVLIPTPEGYVMSSLEKFRSIGMIDEIAFSPVDQRLGVVVDVPFFQQDFKKMLYILTPRITMTSTPRLMM